VCARLLARSRALYLEGQREEALTVPPVLLNTSLPPPVRPSFFQRFILVPGRVDKRIGKECLGWRKSAIRSGKLPVLSSSPPTSRQIFHSPHNRCRAVRPLDRRFSPAVCFEIHAEARSIFSTSVYKHQRNKARYHGWRNI